jgi:hypothetical protein
MRKRGEPSMTPKTLAQSLGSGKKFGNTSENPKSLTQSLHSSGGKKGSGKGIHINGVDDINTTVHIPSAGQMSKKVSAQMRGQKKAKGF